MKTAFDPRHQRRQKIVQELFTWQAQARVRQEKPALNKSQAAKIKSSAQDPSTKGAISEITTIDQIIKASAPEWGIDKINQIDLAILRLAVFELVFERTEPEKVIIDEAVELAKEFGNESSPAFINGALGKALTHKIRLHKIIADKLWANESQLSPGTNLRNDLNATDIEIADLITTIQNKLGVTIDNPTEIKTVGDIENVIDDQI